MSHKKFILGILILAFFAVALWAQTPSNPGQSQGLKCKKIPGCAGVTECAQFPSVSGCTITCELDGSIIICPIDP